jgi:hypothetical protein
MTRVANEQWQKRCDELQDIVDALPKCWRLVDGKLSQTCPIVPGMELWWINEAVIEVGAFNPCCNGYVTDANGDLRKAASCFNSLEAAEASR